MLSTFQPMSGFLPEGNMRIFKEATCVSTSQVNRALHYIFDGISVWTSGVCWRFPWLRCLQWQSWRWVTKYWRCHNALCKWPLPLSLKPYQEAKAMWKGLLCIAFATWYGSSDRAEGPLTWCAVTSSVLSIVVSTVNISAGGKGQHIPAVHTGVSTKV